MEIFYAYECDGRTCTLDGEESGHLVRVLRRRAGDEVNIIDGKGTLYRCSLRVDSPKGAEAEVLEAVPGWGAHPYRLTIGCCPTKNNERFETFVEKAVEIGVDCIVPLIGDRSERKVYKTERAERIALAAAKQSLKAALPEIREAVSVSEFLREPLSAGESVGEPGPALKLIACCFEGEVPRRSIKAALAGTPSQSLPQITVLIGPEGDFSEKEVALAIENGYIPVSLGTSRLRTETAAITAAEAVYFHFM